MPRNPAAACFVSFIADRTRERTIVAFRDAGSIRAAYSIDRIASGSSPMSSRRSARAYQRSVSCGLSSMWTS